MKSLIRFEDTYGLADIFCARRGIDYFDIKSTTLNMVEIDENTFVDFGLGANWSNISSDEVYSIIERGVERVIFVYDMDNESGDKTKIISSKYLEKQIETVKNLFKNIGYNIEVCCLPVVYAAETIMLYQYIKESGVNITSLVNLHNTNVFHLCLMAYFSGVTNIKSAKIVRNYIDISILIDRFTDVRDTDLNKDLKNWIVSGCKLDDDIPSKCDPFKHRDVVEKEFNACKKKYVKYNIDNKILNSNMSKNELLKELELYR